MDAFSAILRRKLGNRYSDDRAIMPKHASAKFSPLNPAAYKGIAVHHSASARGTAPASIADYHVTHNGWAGIGYHVVIRQGVAHYVGDLATQRAHVAGRNHELAGICVTGDYTKEAPRTEDLDTLRLVIEALDELLGKALPINGHGGWALAGHKTECPGAMVGPAREIRAGGGAPVPPINTRVLWMEADSNQVIHLNPAAGLQRAIMTAGMVPTSDEWQHSPRYIAQRAEGLAAGAAEVFVYDRETGVVTRHKRG